MSRYRSSGTADGTSCITMLIIYVIIYLPMVLWTNRSLDFWVSEIKGHEVDVSIWASILLALFAPFLFLANVISEVIRMCL